MKKKSFVNTILKVKNEIQDAKANKDDPTYLRMKAAATLQEIEEKGRKLGVPRAGDQARKLVKRNRWGFSDIATATKTMVAQGPAAMLEEAGFKLGNKLEKKAFAAELLFLGLLASSFLIFCFVHKLLTQAGVFDDIFGDDLDDDLDYPPHRR